MKNRLMITSGLMVSMIFLSGFLNFSPGDKPTDIIAEGNNEKPLIFPVP